ncbi:hypothetical protein PVAND_014736 [Polypedilum vanderplanki]|uniref:DUF4806 domain-containing protein n=1 Tax=Polypedilum vanderplanki TaxID=319348 RepID=A0A9J6BA81_POLVA|nr:hypothetical protein PVAND_014736 [Polypedilum vanderplanki]
MNSDKRNLKPPFVIEKVLFNSNDEFEATEHIEDQYTGQNVKRIKFERLSADNDDSSSIIEYKNLQSTSSFDSISRDIHNLNKRLTKLEETVKTNHKIINNKLNLILDYFLQNAPETESEKDFQISNSSYDDDTSTDIKFVPKPIDSREVFDEIETKLKNFDRDPSANKEFRQFRKEMVKYYSKRLSNVNNRTDPKYGLMHSLMNLYFSNDFMTTIGWTAVGNRWSIKDSKGHFSLFYDIVNANTAHTYANNDEASHAVFTFLRRFHEKKSKEAKLLNETKNESQ